MDSTSISILSVSTMKSGSALIDPVARRFQPSGYGTFFHGEAELRHDNFVRHGYAFLFADFHHTVNFGDDALDGGNHLVFKHRAEGLGTGSELILRGGTCSSSKQSSAAMAKSSAAETAGRWRFVDDDEAFQFS